MALSPIERETIAMDNDKRRLAAAAKRVDYAEREQDIRDREADVYDRARERRLRSQNLAALADPGRYATKYYDQAKQWKDENRLRIHEIDMADKKGEWEVKKEIEHAKGLRGQGAEAAGINAEAKNNETLSRFGYFDDSGEYHPGSDVSVAEKTGLTKFEQQMLRNQNSLDVQNLRNQGSLATQTLRNQGSSDTASVNADAKKSAAEIAASSKVEAANIAAKSASQSDIAKAEVERQKNEQKRMADAMQYAAVTGKDLKTALAEIDALKPNTPDAQKPEPQKVDITQKYKEGDVMMTKQGKAVYKIDPTTGKPKWIVESR